MLRVQIRRKVVAVAAAGILLSLGALPAQATQKRQAKPVICRIDPMTATTSSGPSKSRADWIEIIAAFKDAPATCGTKTVPVTGQLITEIAFPAAAKRRQGNGILVIAVSHELKPSGTSVEGWQVITTPVEGKARYQCAKFACQFTVALQKPGQLRTTLSGTAQFNPKELGIDKVAFTYQKIEWTESIQSPRDSASGQATG